MLNNLSINNKLLVSYSVVFTIVFFMVTLFIYQFVQHTIRVNIESELHNSTESILDMVKTSADVSIKNYLRGVTEKNKELVSSFYDQYKAGVITEGEAKKRAEQVLLFQTIGTSGYIYCLNSQGTVVVHPEKELVHENVADNEFVRSQIKLKKGYIEYQWKNPGESVYSPKALYMTWFEPWDWIISVSTYRTEFSELIAVDDFKKRVLEHRFGKTGYSFVIDRNGKIIIHPKLEGANILNYNTVSNEEFERMVELRKGKIIYPWKNPGEEKAREKLVIFNYIPEFEWIVASSSYLDEFYEPLATIRKAFSIAVIGAFILVLGLTFKISSAITRPLKQLMIYFDRIGHKNFSLRLPVESNDEVGQLVKHFNNYMEQLENYSRDLKEQIRVRIETEGALKESESRYRSVMEAAPDPIVVYDMEGCVLYCNPAFTRDFGWTLDECKGGKMDHFVPEENWPETWTMINVIKSGNALSQTETQRFTKQGDLLSVSISGAVYKDPAGKASGSVIIIRNITEYKRLTKKLMDIADTERQKLGQDLHDDLCPHLIGIQSLSTVLATNLAEESSSSTHLSKKVISLVNESIEKARNLARGACPVHFVKDGLSSAIEEMAANFSRSTDIDFDIDLDEPVSIPGTTEGSHLYYIAQEAIVNAVKHSKAECIMVSLISEKDVIRLIISDNGKGFSQTNTVKGIGLEIMKYRAKMIGAFLDIETGFDQGTTIHLKFYNTKKNE